MNTNPPHNLNLHNRDRGGNCTEGVPLPASSVPFSLARFLDTLGMADDVPWKPTHDNEEPPF